MSSLISAVALLAEAIVRMAMAYALPVTAVPAAQTGLLIITTLLMQVVTGVYYAHTGLWSMIGMPWGQPHRGMRHERHRDH